MPDQPVYCQNGWERTGIMYHGFPVFVNRSDGTMVYEADFERLVSVPEHVEHAIVDVLFGDWQISQLSPEAREALAARAS